VPKMELPRSGHCCYDEMWSVIDCLHPDTNIMTHNDIVKVNEAFHKNPLLSVDLNKNRIINAVATHQVKRPLKVNEKLIKIRTKTREIKVSENHRFFTMGRDPNYFNRHKDDDIPNFTEKNANELRKKDRVVMVHKLPEPKEELISEDLAQFLGYVMGDGSIEYPHRWSIHMDDKSIECLNEYEKIARRLNLNTTNHYKHKGKNCRRLRCFKKQKIEKILEEIQDCIIVKKTSTKIIKIPEKVIKSNNRILGKFLRGFYDAEGSVIIDKSLPREFGRIIFGIKERDNVEKIKYLLMRFGIECSMPKKNSKRDFYRIDIKDTLSIKNFKEKIGFSHPEKMKKLEQINLNFGTKRKIYGDIEIGFITNIERIKENVEYLTDFTVPAYENYVANGFLVHNSRASASNRNKIVSNILLRSRKRDLTYMFSSQMLDLLDKRLRKILDFTAYTILNPQETIGKTLIFRGGYPKEGMILKTMRFYTHGVFQLYNTNEEIDMKSEDDNSPPLITFQESPDHPPKYFDTYEACDKFAEAYYAKNIDFLSLLMAGQ
jgi:intein/homing endonuclease